MSPYSIPLWTIFTKCRSQAAQTPADHRRRPRLNLGSEASSARIGAS